MLFSCPRNVYSKHQMYWIIVNVVKKVKYQHVLNELLYIPVTIVDMLNWILLLQESPTQVYNR